MAQPVVGLPGRKAERTATPRKILVSDMGAMTWPAGKIIDGSESRDSGNTGDLDVLRAGIAMGKQTSSGKYAPSILGVLASAEVVTATTITVTAAQAVEINRRLTATGTLTLVGPPTAAGVVAVFTEVMSAIDTATGVITLGALDAALIAGSFVMDNDGTEVPVFLIGDGYGVKVTDQDDVNTDVPFRDALFGGIVDASQIILYPSDASLKTWIKQALNGEVTDSGATTRHREGHFAFDDEA